MAAVVRSPCSPWVPSPDAARLWDLGGWTAEEASKPSPHDPCPKPPAAPPRPSPAQDLDLQIFPKSKIMARRWLRSPRIRNTFMVQLPTPRPRPANFQETFRRALAHGPPVPRPRPVAARAPPACQRLPALCSRSRSALCLRRQRTLCPSVTWPGRPRARGGEPGSCAAGIPPSVHSSAGLREAGQRERLGASGLLATSLPRSWAQPGQAHEVPQFPSVPRLRGVGPGLGGEGRGGGTSTH